MMALVQRNTSYYYYLIIISSIITLQWFNIKKATGNHLVSKNSLVHIP